MAETTEKTNKPGEAGKRKRPSQSELSDFVFGKIPPQALDLEEAVLGAVMLEQGAAAKVLDIISPESFYADAHQRIFRAVMSLFGSTRPIDILTVTEELRKTSELDLVGGPYYIAQLTNRVASSANIEYHATLIAQKFIQRELIRTSSIIIRDAYEESTDVLELLDRSEKELFSITQKNLRKDFAPLPTLISKTMKEMQDVKLHKNELTGVPSGFIELDRITTGWQRSDLIIVAARPGMGKTAFVLSLARNASLINDAAVAIFSLEMSAQQLATRLISAEAEIPSDKLRRPGTMAQHEWQQLYAKVAPLDNAKIFIDDTPAINIFDLRSKCRRMKMQHNIQLIIIDYLQLMSGTGDNRQGNREQEISNISRSLKSIAKELDVPVITLSQLSRAVETRGGSKKPQLSDLRESGAIEQDADMVLFIYRPEYYGFTEDGEGNSVPGLAEIIIAKHRNGPTGSVPIRFIDRFAKFVDMNSSDISTLVPIASTRQQPSNDEGNIVIRRSKMNDMPDDENMPF